ncbi:DUF5133 domain-containing protein [Streptomyces sp. NBC_01498]|uniref:DUF5133 domain-containing protein n=1 Tax=Streptomyces sp. NBC_01498 TaxID=2975870 RepID=UPI002E7B8D5B|nr:DUF5133 domain-containing protein [Streptomyces sp. NBC_01498]WTL23762.1 DUF5133 domain-containing protein [Streptomyces sp. NBC_01498]
MLLPDKAGLAQLLRRYRTWERLVLREPHDPVRRRRLDDVAYTLCVLMGHRTVAEAVRAAESYLGAVARGDRRAPAGRRARGRAVSRIRRHGSDSKERA